MSVVDCKRMRRGTQVCSNSHLVSTLVLSSVGLAASFTPRALNCAKRELCDSDLFCICPARTSSHNNQGLLVVHRDQCTVTVHWPRSVMCVTHQGLVDRACFGAQHVY